MITLRNEPMASPRMAMRPIRNPSTTPTYLSPIPDTMRTLGPATSPTCCSTTAPRWRTLRERDRSMPAHGGLHEHSIPLVLKQRDSA